MRGGFILENDNELGINFETGEVSRGELVLMNLDEMLFLLHSAVRYNTMFPIEESEKFIAELRDQIGLGFNTEQFNEFKIMMQQMNK